MEKGKPRQQEPDAISPKDVKSVAGLFETDADGLEKRARTLRLASQALKSALDKEPFEIGDDSMAQAEARVNQALLQHGVAIELAQADSDDQDSSKQPMFISRAVKPNKFPFTN